MPTQGEWVLLAYRMPREPSTPRISVWRRLKRLGVAQLGDGLVALPARPETREQLEWAAEEVTDAGGEATIWLARPSSRGEEQALQERLAAAVAADYRAVIDAAHTAPADPAARRRTVRRLRRTLHAIVARDFFPPTEREEAHAAVESLARLVEVV
jgi:DNA-binding PucR family transcriptional regulator